MTSTEMMLPEIVTIGDYPLLKALSQLNSGIYRVKIPDGIEGSLMQLTTGENAGLHTTSIVSAGKIVGTAGLEQIDVDKETTQLLLNLRNYGALSSRVNKLSRDFSTLYNHQVETYHAEVSNMFEMFRDISRKMPSILDDTEYSPMALQTLSMLKKDAGQFFEYHKQLFMQQYGDLNSNYNDSASALASIDAFRRHSVFKAFEILLTIEIFEIMISGKANPRFIKAARTTLNERIKSIIYIIESHHSRIINLFDRWVYNRRDTAMTHKQHTDLESHEHEMLALLEKKYLSAIDISLTIDEYFDDSLSIEGIKEFQIQIINGNTALTDGRNLLLN